jgi:hypothetical protein
LEAGAYGLGHRSVCGLKWRELERIGGYKWVLGTTEVVGQLDRVRPIVEHVVG